MIKIFDIHKIKSFFLLILLLVSSSLSFTQSLSEAYVKSSLIFDISEFFTWKNETDIKKFKIGVFGKKPDLYKELENLAKIHEIKNKPVSVIHFDKLKNISKTHILLTDRENSEKIEEINQIIAGNNTLIITDNCDCWESTMINFLSLEEQRKWFEDHGPNNPIVVAEQDGLVVGWAALSKYSTRCAYSDTAEISLYVTDEYQNKGIGKKLMEKIVQEGEKAGLHALIARITDGNEISVQLHKSAGFEHIGIMKQVGLKFDKRLDVHLMQKVYKN